MSISMLPETRWSRCPRHTNQWSRPASRSKAGVSQRSARCAGVRTRSLAGQRYGRYRQMSDAPVFVQLEEGSNDLWRLDEIADIIKYGGVGIVPTDSFPALVCDMCNKAAVDKLYYLRHLQHSKPLSILCRSFADINKYTLGFPTSNVPGQKDTFRLVKELLPGPYTFILHASKELPKLVLSSPPQIKSKTRRTVGIRMPDQPVCQALLQRVDAPLVVTSAHVAADEMNFEVPDAAHLMDMYPGVDFVIDIGPHLAQGSSVVDMTGPTPVIVRRGLGDVSAFE